MNDTVSPSSAGEGVTESIDAVGFAGGGVGGPNTVTVSVPLETAVPLPPVAVTVKLMLPVASSAAGAIVAVTVMVWPGPTTPAVALSAANAGAPSSAKVTVSGPLPLLVRLKTTETEASCATEAVLAPPSKARTNTCAVVTLTVWDAVVIPSSEVTVTVMSPLWVCACLSAGTIAETANSPLAPAATVTSAASDAGP